MADFCWKAFCPMHQRMNEDLKRDIRDEVEFRQAQLNAQAQRLRGTVHMYQRDARMFVEQRDDSVARQMLVQKTMMEQRIAVMATHWSVLESVRVSLQPSERRSMGDLTTCRAILNKTGLEFIEPVVRREGDHEERAINLDTIDMELRDLQAEVFPPVGGGWDSLGGRGGGGGGEGSSSGEAIATGSAPVDLLGEPDGSDRPGVSEAEALLGPGAAGQGDLGGAALRKACAASVAAAEASSGEGEAPSEPQPERPADVDHLAVD